MKFAQGYTRLVIIIPSLGIAIKLAKINFLKGLRAFIIRRLNVGIGKIKLLDYGDKKVQSVILNHGDIIRQQFDPDWDYEEYKKNRERLKQK